MFQKTKIAAATLALLGATVAQNVSAVAIADGGSSAQVLVFPYYNTNNGFQTAFNIRNTKDEYKVLKVRFRESGISNDVLDFNVYMSPYDHFSLTLAKNAAGDAIMTTQDTTCTYPPIPAAGVPLNYKIYDNTDQADTAEGYLEVIEQGLVRADNNDDIGKKIFDAIKHRPDGIPGNCGLVAKAWEDSYFTQGGASKAGGGFYGNATPKNMGAPTGGLQGYSILIDTIKGAALVADPVAIRNYSTGAQHYKSDDPSFYLLPSLASGNVLDSTVMNNAGTGVVTNTWTTVAADWGLSDPGIAPNTGVASGVNPFPMADVLAATGLNNDYFINPAFDAATDWVVTFPMRKHGIYNDYLYDGIAKTAAHPVNLFVSSGTNVEFTSKFYDREEQIPAPSASGFSPVGQAGKKLLDREVNILSFTNTDNATRKVLGSESPFVFTLESGFVQGWAKLMFTQTGGMDATHNALGAWVGAGGVAGMAKGIPTIGFAAIRGNLGSGSSNVGETIPHVFTRDR